MLSTGYSNRLLLLLYSKGWYVISFYFLFLIWIFRSCFGNPLTLWWLIRAWMDVQLLVDVFFFFRIRALPLSLSLFGFVWISVAESLRSLFRWFLPLLDQHAIRRFHCILITRDWWANNATGRDWRNYTRGEKSNKTPQQINRIE